MHSLEVIKLMNEKTTYKVYDEVSPYTIKDARIVMLLAKSRKLRAENERLQREIMTLHNTQAMREAHYQDGSQTLWAQIKWRDEEIARLREALIKIADTLRESRLITDLQFMIKEALEEDEKD